MPLIIASKQNEAQLVEYASSISKKMREWQLITVRLVNTNDTPDEIIKQLMEMYENRDGMIFNMSERKIVLLVRLGQLANYNELQNNIEKNISQNRCRVIARQMTKSGIKQVQIDFTKKKTDSDLNAPDMFEERLNRADDIALIIDDDEFVRTAISASIGSYFTKVHGSESDKNAVSDYKSLNPDIVFLDIHLQGEKSGLQLIEEILAVDIDAFIVLISSDSVKENVLEAMDKGAIGFLSKPPQIEKIKHYITNCRSIGNSNA